MELRRQACFDPLVGSSGFDFIADLGAQMPMRVIGMLLGIPEEDQEELRDRIDAGLSLEEGETSGLNDAFSNARFKEYVEWRRKHPSDDLMTELMTAKFVDDAGALRTL